MGSRRSKQCFGKFFDLDGSSCALGALMIGSNIIGSPGDWIGTQQLALPSKFPSLMRQMACPACRNVGTLSDIVLDLNDNHKWSRERIAGWIESHVETPVYSLLQMQEYMDDPAEIAAKAE